MTVVMPTLNQAEFIESAVRSVLSQSYSNLTLVVADGGSTDSTLMILARLGAEYRNRLCWTSASDDGAADALASSFSRLHCDIVGWLNSDDLYAPGAIRRAVDALSEDDSTLLVFGRATNIDREGRCLGDYPSQGGGKLQDFIDGCFICQPTVFFKRELIGLVGLPDNKYRTAFDFEYWLRIYKKFPLCIKYIKQLQASSRIYGGTLTSTYRELVAIESINAIAQHIAPAPSHWLRTHYDEIFEKYPYDGKIDELNHHCWALFEAVSKCLSAQARTEILAFLENSACLKYATSSSFVAVYPDNWAKPVCELRFRGPQPARAVSILCKNGLPKFRPLNIQITWPDGRGASVSIPGGRSETLQFSIPNLSVDERYVISLVADSYFVPSKQSSDSNDNRMLSFLIDRFDCNEEGFDSVG